MTSEHPHTQIAPLRRPKFPSWSWAGWAHGANWRILDGNDYLDTFVSSVKAVYTETTPGVLTDIELMFPELTSTCSPAIYLDVWVILPDLVQIVDEHPGYGLRIVGLPNGSDAGFIHDTFRCSSKKFVGFLQSQKWCLAVLGSYASGPSGEKSHVTYFMVIEKQVGHFTKLGIASAVDLKFEDLKEAVKLERICLT